MVASDFAYFLPKELIAAHPSERRDGARLLVVKRAQRTWEHRSVSELPTFVEPGDLWIFNNSKVLPARLLTEDRSIELLLLEESSPRHWLALASPGKKTRQHATFQFPARVPNKPPLSAEVLRTLDTGERVVRFHADFNLEDYGQMPLPPYILERRGENADATEEDRERYQTIYAALPGSVAAPTAGLHFTPAMMAALPHAFLTLHVGLGTFRPVKVEKLEEHEMHEEKYSISAAVAEQARAARRRVVVGTTTARVLESLTGWHGAKGSTRIFIHPPYTFQRVDALVTNFHLPKSTLLMLVSAFMSSGTGLSTEEGLDFMKAVYNEAVKEHYRFFSYGDAMLII